MTRTLAALETALVESPTLAVANLIQLTTYSNRLTLANPTEHYISEATRLWDWEGGGVQEFIPVLVEVGNVTDSIEHLTDPESTGSDSPLRRRRNLILRNYLAEDGTNFWDTLTTSGAREVLNARMVWTQLPLDLGGGADWWDLRDQTSSDEIRVYHGRVTRVLSVSDDQIELELESELPTVPWLYADDASQNDPADLGKRLPMPVGSAERVEAVGWTVGATSTLASDLEAGGTTFEVTDLSAFPSSGTIYIGSEKISYTGTTDNSVDTGVVRALGSTGDVLHGIGELVTEVIDPAVWVLSAYEVKAINAVYVLSPFDGVLVRLDSSMFSFTTSTADTTTISGETVASISFTGEELGQLIQKLAVNATILGTAVSGGVTAQGVSYITQTGAFVFPASADQFASSFTPAAAYSTTTFSFNAVPGAFNDQTIRITWDASATLASAQPLSIDGTSVPGGWTRPAGGGTQTIGPLTTEGNTLHGLSPSYIESVERDVDTDTGTTTSSQAFPTSGSGSWASAVDANLGTYATSETYTFDDVAGSELYQILYLYLTAGDSITLKKDSSGGVQLWRETSVQTTGWHAITVYGSYAGTTTYYVGGDCYEIKRSVVTENDPGQLIPGATVGNGLRFFADVDGAFAPCEYAVRYDCDNDASNWTAGGAGTASDETTIVAPGSTDSLKLASGSAAASWVYRTWAAEDWSAKTCVRLYVYVTLSANLSANDGLGVRFSSDVGGGTNYKEWRFGTDDGLAAATWVQLTVDLEESSTTLHGAMDLTSMEYMSITGGLIGPTASDTFYFDEIELETGTSTNYEALSGELIEEGPDILRHFLVEVCGEAHGDLDSSFATAATNLGSAVFGGDVRNLGLDFEQVVQRMGYEFRSSIQAVDGTSGREWRILTPTTSYAFPAASGENLTEWESILREEPQQRATRFNYLYQYHRHLGEGVDAFLAAEQSTDTTAEDAIGRVEGETAGFFLINDSTTSAEVVDWYTQERAGLGSSYRLLGVPPWEAYLLEPGDIRSLELPATLGGSTVKVRVLEIQRNPDTELADLTCRVVS